MQARRPTALNLQVCGRFYRATGHFEPLPADVAARRWEIVPRQPEPMTRFRRQIEAYRMSRRIVKACNRMGAGRGPALQWCLECRFVLKWMIRIIRRKLYP